MTLRRLVPRLDGRRSVPEVLAGLGLDGERLLTLQQAAAAAVASLP